MQFFENSSPSALLAHQSFLLGRDQPPLDVSAKADGGIVRLHLQKPDDGECILHWGVAQRSGGGWTRPSHVCSNVPTEKFDQIAVRTPFVSANGLSVIDLEFKENPAWRFMEFVLYYPQSGKYIKNRRYDFSFALPMEDLPQVDLEKALEKLLPGEVEHKDFTLDNGFRLLSARQRLADGIKVVLVSDGELPLMLHWGVGGQYADVWSLPPTDSVPAGTVAFDERSVRTPFEKKHEASAVELFFRDGEDVPANMFFLLYKPDEDSWIKSGGNDLSIRLFRKKLITPFEDERVVELAATIIGAEVGRSSWTLMHRFGLARELLQGNADNEQSLAAIYVWLRFSAIRQLDWQRRYNTKPRDLAGAQQALTGALAEAWLNHPQSRIWLRRIMQTVGRGGDGGQGQQIRDEILNIMHRHKISERHGIFLEEWHQKLHNNTTPDDVCICKAYLDYLRSNGRLDVFYDSLHEQGIDRARLQGYERPIVTEPIFYHDKKDGLIHDFENYLNILNAVHGGGDIRTAIGRAWNRVDGGLRARIDSAANNGASLEELVRLREDLRPAIDGASDAGAVLDLVYLDIALEDMLRRQVEGIATEDISFELLPAALKVALLDGLPEELGVCLRQWHKLSSLQREGTWHLESLSCLERMARVVQDFGQQISALVQPVADFLGTQMKCEEWSVKLFAEETVRGGGAFAPAKVLHVLIPKMREEAGIGGWQVVSPGSVTGEVVQIDDLHAVQEKEYDTPTVLLVERAGGNEEVPEGVVGIITREAPDLVSHLSVRARNLGVVLVACFEDGAYGEIADQCGDRCCFATTPSGALEVSPAQDGIDQQEDKKEFDASAVSSRDFTAWAVGSADFSRQILGGKSNNLVSLEGKLPEFILLPQSMAVPFGACEEALKDPINSALAKNISDLICRAVKAPGEYLPLLRADMLKLKEPDGFQEAFMAVWKTCDRFEKHEWDEIWMAVKRVWASKWNERAFLSRRHLKLPHEKLQMAVLVQQVVRADYAFVAHTVNPVSGNKDEIFAEVVLGLGETLVGNFPGRALGFTCNRNTLELNIVSMPGKSVGLFGGGVIFRSDSNGEDLEGFAGAGLYDSYLAREPQEKVLDYADEPLMRDVQMRDDMLRKIAKACIEVEKVCGAPQDIEGAFENGQLYIVQNRPQVGL